MPYDFLGAALILVVLTALATLLRHERRTRRWLMRNARRRRKALRRPVLF